MLLNGSMRRCLSRSIGSNLKPHFASFSTRGFEIENDYVIVGAGSAGCVLANRLSEAGKNVTLLEGGGTGTLKGPKSLFTRMPTALSIPMHFDEFNYGFLAEPEEVLNGRRITCPRGRGLGGSSSINGMVYVRGHPCDYEAWKEAGAEGWGWPDVAPYFHRMENWGGEDDAEGLHGRDGPLHVKFGGNALETPLFDVWKKAGGEAGYGETEDYNGVRQEGMGPMPMTVFHSGPRKGERCSAAAAYLDPAMSRDNLDLVTDAAVAKILWEGEDEAAEAGSPSTTTPRAIGVELQDGRRVLARKEVILSAGAIASPQLLQVSGVGDADHLKSIGVECKLNLPGVGQNLQDHLEVYFQHECTEKAQSLAPYLSLWRKALIGIRWLLFRDGLGATNHFEGAGFIRSSEGVEYPDIQYHFLPVAVSYDGVTMPPTESGHSFQLHLGHNRSNSRGAVTATSPDMRDAPKCKFNYMSTPEDWAAWRKALRLTREIIAQPVFDGFRSREIMPGAELQTDEELDGYLKEHLESAYHPCGTCKMGAEDDPTAVVRADGTVRGTSNLRVVDSSIFPSIPNGNLNGPTIMVAEKMSDAILEEKLAPGGLETSFNSPRGWVDPNWETKQREAQPVGGGGVSSS